MLQNIANADTFPTYKALVEKGKFKPEVAELLINTFKQLSDDFAKNLITKEEFELAKEELLKEINQLRTDISSIKVDILDIKKTIDRSEQSFDYKLSILKKELIIINSICSKYLL